MDPFFFQRITSSHQNRDILEETTTKRETNRIKGGVESGWVKCVLCSIKSQKRFAAGRGIMAHLQNVHKTLTKNELNLAIEDSMKSLIQSNGLTRDGKSATKYQDALPLACQYAKTGNRNDLYELRKDNLLLFYEKDKYGATCLDWACGEGHLFCVQYLVSLLSDLRTFNPKLEGSALINEETIGGNGSTLTSKLSWKEFVKLSEIPDHILDLSSPFYLHKKNESLKNTMVKYGKKK